MSDLRLWVTLLAAVSALAGLAGGMLLAEGGKPILISHLCRSRAGAR